MSSGEHATGIKRHPGEVLLSAKDYLGELCGE